MITIKLLKGLGFKKTGLGGYELEVSGLTFLSVKLVGGVIGVTIYESDDSGTTFLDFNELSTFVEILKRQKTYGFYSKNLTSIV